MILTNMTIKNPLRGFPRSRRFDSSRGYDHFEWIDDSIYDKVMSTVVYLITSNETLIEENQQLQTIKEERAYDDEL